MKKTKIIIIAAGSFQGKSLVALALAERLKYSAVVSTDTVRNILHVINPEQRYLATSSYLLSPDLFSRQVNEVSAVLMKMLDIYNSRGEHLIIEGVHISEDLIEWAMQKDNVLVMALNNQLSLEERVIYKTVTRSRLRILAENSKDSYIMTSNINDNNVQKSSYVREKARIEEIHQTLINQVKNKKWQVINYSNIDEAIEQAYATVKSWEIDISGGNHSA